MEFAFSERIAGLDGAATREILKHTANGTVIGFAGGMPGRDCYPASEIAQVTERLLDGERYLSLLTYGPTDGAPQTKEAMLRHAARFGLKGLRSENVLVVSGGQQGLFLACMAMLDKGDVVLVEDPTYLTMLQIVAGFGARCVGVAATDEGLDIDDLEAKIRRLHPKMLYIVPTFSNPTGRTYSLANRRAIAEVTERNGLLVVEDDPYSLLRFEGEPVPSLKSVGGDNVLFVTSFSKIVSPGLRVGCCYGAPEAIRKMEICKQGVDVQTPSLNQAIVEQMIERDLIAPHLARVLPIYRARKGRMLAALRREMAGLATFGDVAGGLFLWGKADPSLDTHALFPACVARGVAYLYGDVFFANDAPKNYLRLNFSNASDDEIERGVRALAEVFSAAANGRRRNPTNATPTARKSDTGSEK